MKSKTKILALVLVPNLPLLALTMYFGFRVVEHPLPMWTPYFFLSYFLVTIISGTVLSRRISSNPQAKIVEKPQSVLRWIWNVWSGYLVAYWSGLFLWLAHETISGKPMWQRTVPAGALLLVFIALFSRSLFKEVKGAIQNTSASKEKTANKM
jgi:hypothetical protein